MSGRQRNIRRQKATLSFDDDEGEEAQDEGPAALPPAAKAAAAAAAAKREKQRAAQKKATLLSFDDDAGDGAEGGAAAKAKPARPKGVMRAPGAAAPPPAADERAARVYTQVSAAGEYTVEKLRELQKNARSAPNSKPAYKPVAAASGGFKLSGSFKPAAPPKDDRFQYNVNAAGVVRPEEKQPARGAGPAGGSDMPLPPPVEPPPPAAGGSPQQGAAPPAPAAAAPAAAAAEDEGEEPDIPDEEMIAWAKAKRERLRGAHLAPDYIPTAAAPPGLSRLRDKKKAEEAVVAGSASESEDEAEAELRMKFAAGPTGASAGGATGRPGSGRGGRRAGAAAAEADDGEEDEEWAQEQIRKGMGGLLHPGRGGSSAALAAEGEAAAGGGGTASRAAATALAAGGGSQAAAIQAAADEVMRTLQAGLHRLQMSRQQAEQNLERTSTSLQNSLAAITRMEGELEAASAKYVQVQGLKAYVADLCSMLQDKSVLVEELEDALLDLCEGRASALEARRTAADAEEHAPAEAAVAAATAVLSRGGADAAAAATSAAAAAAAAAEERLLGKDLPVELDEFGRDANAERRAELAQRAKQRQARLAALEQQWEQQRGQAGGPAEPHLGDDTTEESEGEVSHFRMRQGEVQEAADAVFRDADDEYGSLPAVKQRLEEWKARQPGAYRDAYVSLSAPALFAPFVRLELLKWRPLHGGDTGFDSHQWYQQLFDYGMPQDPSLLDPNDPDANLVPQLVQKLVLPMAKQLLTAVWSPYSRRQSRAAAAMLADLMVYVPAEEEALVELVAMVQGKLEAAVEGLALPAWPPAALAASRRAALHLARRFGRGLRLLAGVCAFDGSLPRAALQRLALDKLVAARLLPYARAAAGNPPLAADRVSRIVGALPAEWFRPSAPPPRGGEAILELLTALARVLEAQALGGNSASVLAQAARQVASALHKLGDVPKANKLAKAYGVL
ncbi:hypothetical protein ABPG77_002298 [Micractinium sp. CCAP 211/92]